ncbi:OmpA family protein [Aurantibacter crassamenti]|uniref:OmpA family protein n=1 Tax=Aurantibacter crassamenti TaxID=1837375 RepID=UPI001939B000|nr:OmpA family protein [Aurantibacter crassamenti]MBM1106023.1 OmpA family protein [Aurantibacter crassamenti]
MHKLGVFLVLILMAFSSFGQEKKMSRGDAYFYSYDYEAAIRAYKKQMVDGELISNSQLLNLADSYFRTSDYLNATKLYLDIHKNDTIMSNSRFNSMLQSMAKTSEREKVRAFLETKRTSYSSEWIENADFNYELLDSNLGQGSGFFIFNLDANSPQADFSPTFYKDKLLFSSSRSAKSKKVYEPSGESYLDIFVANIAKNGNIQNPNQFDGLPETKFHKSTPYYSEELKRIFYVLSNAEGDNLSFDDKGKNSLAIGMVYDNGFFRYLLKDMSISFYYPFYDSAAEKLYFSANFEDGYGGTDIYVVNTNNGQIMSEPINLGPRVNSPGNEIAPYIYDGNLYFSSDVFYGLGGMDIYKSSINSDNTYGVPVNLGAGINSKSDEFGFIIKENGDEGLIGYFASNKSGGKGNDDIYGFKVTGTPGLKTLSYHGRVVRAKNEDYLAEAIVSLIDEQGKLIREVKTKANGTYQLEVPWRANTSLKVHKEKYGTFYQKFGKAETDELGKKPLNIKLAHVDDVVEQKEDKAVVKMKDFYFATGKSLVTSDIALELDKAVAASKYFPEMQFRIETHTDSKGSTSANKKLSQSRADAIRGYLAANGVPTANIISASGYGESQLVNNCKNGVYCLDFLHKQNDRTLIVVANIDAISK